MSTGLAYYLRYAEVDKDFKLIYEKYKNEIYPEFKSKIEELGKYNRFLPKRQNLEDHLLGK